MSVKLNWRGKEYKERVRVGRTKALISAGVMVATQDKLFCPVITGRARGAITWQTASEGSSVSAPAKAEDAISKPKSDDEVRIGSAVVYDPYIEGIINKGKATPHHRPALDQNRGNILDLFKREVRAAL